MRKISGSILILSLCAALAAGCGSDSTFQVKGTIAGAKNGTLYLQKEEEGHYLNVDSLEMGKNGKFEFTGDATEPQMYYLAFGKAAPVLSFFAESGTITIDARIDSLQKAKVKAGREQELYDEFLSYIRDFSGKKDKVYLDILRSSVVDGDKDSIEVYRSMYQSLERRQAQFVANFVLTHSDSRVAPLMAHTFLNQGYSPLLDSLVKSMSPEVADSKYGREFAGFVSAAKNTLVGMSAPDFELKKDTTAYSLSSFAGKELFLVVWSAGNQENIDYMSALKQVYGKWHDRGLEVLSSCISQNDEQYGYDIYSLNLPWAEVRDARGMKNTLIDKFALTGNLPAGLLIGRDGTILARYITPEDLDKVLDYLSKNAYKSNK